MHERIRFERELADLDAREFDHPLPLPPATIGFEFDVHYGLIDEVVADAGKTMPANNALITTHNDADDKFRVKRDGPRLEIATKPFTLDATGKDEIKKAKTKIAEFAAELKAKCGDAPEKSIAVSGVTGKPRPFTYPKTVIADLPLVKLPFGGKFPTDCAVWASPQATVTVPLYKVRALITAIQATEGKGPGIALSGGSGTRMGVRSTAAYKARDAVDRIWPKLKKDNPGITEDLRGFLILLAMYLWTSELRYKWPVGDVARKGDDYEPFAKAYLPLNVKAPFPVLFKELLTDTEKDVFRANFGEGDARKAMFRLAKSNAELADGDRFLFPPGPKELGKDSVHERQKVRFTTVPTWNDLLAHTLDKTHNGWGERLMVPISKIIPFSVTTPRVAIELRRIGWASVFAKDWPGMIDRIVKMAEKLT